MKRLAKITLEPRESDALYVMQGLALHTCTKHQCDVEFTFKGVNYALLWREVSSCFHNVVIEEVGS